MSADIGGDRAISLYGTSGTPTHLALTEEILKREGGAGVALSPSGLAAITVALLSVVKAGDHVLITDSAYMPLRNLALRFLPKMGVEFDFYDPLLGKDISKLIRSNTRCVWVESPGSLTFEVQVQICEPDTSPGHPKARPSSCNRCAGHTRDCGGGPRSSPRHGRRRRQHVSLHRRPPNSRPPPFAAPPHSPPAPSRPPSPAARRGAGTARRGCCGRWSWGRT